VALFTVFIFPVNPRSVAADTRFFSYPVFLGFVIRSGHLVVGVLNPNLPVVSGVVEAAVDPLREQPHAAAEPARVWRLGRKRRVPLSHPLRLGRLVPLSAARGALVQPAHKDEATGSALQHRAGLKQPVAPRNHLGANQALAYVAVPRAAAWAAAAAVPAAAAAAVAAATAWASTAAAAAAAVTDAAAWASATAAAPVAVATAAAWAGTAGACPVAGPRTLPGSGVGATPALAPAAASTQLDCFGVVGIDLALALGGRHPGCCYVQLELEDACHTPGKEIISGYFFFFLIEEATPTWAISRNVTNGISLPTSTTVWPQCGCVLCVCAISAALWGGSTLWG